MRVGSWYCRPMVDVFVVAFDNASGGLISELQKLKRMTPDPMALLEAIQAASEAAGTAAANPPWFLLKFLKELVLETGRRILAWLRQMYHLLSQVLLGLVPIAHLAWKLFKPEEGGVDGNIIRVSLYKPDDVEFLANAENFVQQMVAQRERLLSDSLSVKANSADPAVHPFQYLSACLSQIYPKRCVCENNS